MPELTFEGPTGEPCTTLDGLKQPDNTWFTQMAASTELMALHLPPEGTPLIVRGCKPGKGLHPLTSSQIQTLTNTKGVNSTITQAKLTLRGAVDNTENLQKPTIKGALILDMDQPATINSYQFLLDGPISEQQVPLAPLTILNIPRPTEPAMIDVDPVSIQFPRGRSYTQWKTLTETGMSVGADYDPTMQERILARWRIRATSQPGSKTYAYKLVLELLIIPSSHDAIAAMSAHTRELIEGPGAPTFIGYCSEPIQWVQPQGEQPISNTNVGLPVLPWLSIKRAPLAVPTPTPTDAFLRR